MNYNCNQGVNKTMISLMHGMGTAKGKRGSHCLRQQNG